MKRSAYHILILGVLALMGCAGDSKNATPVEDIDAKIRNLTKAYVTSANAKDVARVVAFYTPDAVLLPPNHAAVEGHDAIRRYFQSELMDAGFSDFDNQPIKIEHSGDLAYQRGSYVFQLVDAKGGKKVERGKYVVVWKRMPNKEWRMLIDSWSSDSPH